MYDDLKNLIKRQTNKQNKVMLDRKEIFKKAVHDCFVELYAKAQPPADYDNLIEELKAGKIDEKNDAPIHNRHYISDEELEYIVNKYINAYEMTEHWTEYCEIVEQYLDSGGVKNKHIEATTDEDGNYHPSYKGYEDVAPLKDNIKPILDDVIVNGEISDSIAQKITDKVMELISNCKKFYKFDREAEQFRAAIYLGASPSTKKNIVAKWWKEKYNVDIKFEDRIPELLWYYDSGYTDEELEYEFEDYGKNWKEKLMKEWQDKVEEKRRQQEERLKQYIEENGKHNS